ncbi:MAG: hypothetical protein E7286_02375 [Lachnospiraceae bacterium]|nr:hypothetical protein [Lachnospiraceae bacterium]
MLLGYSSRGEEVRTAQNVANGHVVVTGMSGMGKSCELLGSIADQVAHDQTVIFFDFDGTFGGEPLFPINRIDAKEDGLAIHILEEDAHKMDRVEFIAYVSQVVEMLVGAQNLGIRQIGALREAVEYATEYRKNYRSDFEAIADGLHIQETSYALGAYNKLWPILEAGVFRESPKKFISGVCNVIDLSILPEKMQNSFVEIILRTLWSQARKNRCNNCNLTIVIDEFQRLVLNKNAVLGEMLREARRFGINMVLATQSLNLFSGDIRSSIEQAATKIYFRPTDSEIKKAASLIDPQHIEKYILMLKNLRRGQAIVVGRVQVGGQVIDKPIIIRNRPMDIERYHVKMPLGISSS